MPRLGHIDLQSEDQSAGGIRLTPLIRSLRGTGQQHGFEAFTPYRVQVSRRAAEELAARAVALRGDLRRLEYINQFLTWRETPEGYEFWYSIFYGGLRRGLSEEIRRIITGHAKNLLSNEVEQSTAQIEGLGRLTGSRVLSHPLTSCCKARWHYDWGNGDPERDGRVRTTKADIHAQYHGRKGGPDLNELNIAVLRESQVKKLGEPFLESLGWYRLTTPQNKLCRHAGVSLFARNSEGTDLRVKAVEKKVRGASS